MVESDLYNPGEQMASSVYKKLFPFSVGGLISLWLPFFLGLFTLFRCEKMTMSSLSLF